MNKQENFKRIATKRKSAIIEKVLSLKNLSNKSFYDYTSADIKSLFDEIEEIIEETKKHLLESAKKGK